MTRLPDFPLATDLQTDFLRIPSSDVRQSYNGDLTGRLGADVLRDLLHVGDRVWREDVREIIHQPRWGGNLDSSLKK